MNPYLKEFLHRGLMFGGFGPIIVGIIFCALEHTAEGFSIGGDEILLAVFSTYLLAFVQAGSSIFHQIEHWSPARALLCQLGLLYAAYVGCYLINTWIPFDALVIVIFTAIFSLGYLTIWGIVYFAVRLTKKRINRALMQDQ